MSISPFSSNEIKSLQDLIEKNGWKINGLIENYFRYSLKKEKIILFTIKCPVTLPIRINIPFEIASLRISLAFQLWNLNQNAYNVIIYFMKMLRNLAISLSFEQEFPIKGKEQRLMDLLNLIIPELITGENETTWLNRIRISLMNKREQLKEFSYDKLKKLIETLEDAGLEPSFKLPWELKHGVPKIRTSETIFFSNDEKFDEFFLLEKGYFTYFKDLEFNKFYIRTLFDSYAPYILNDLYNDSSDFKLEAFIEKWIKFARMILNSIIGVIQKGEIRQNELVSFRPGKELVYYSKNFIKEQNNFPFSALCYESSIAKELFPIHNDLFNKPPTNFEVIESINHYTNAEELIKNYRFEEATKILNDALKIFNKNQQKKVVVSILLKLRKIATLLNQEGLALNYLLNALGVAKSGEIPIEFIIKIHYKLGRAYFKKKDFGGALYHFNIIINFLENEDTSISEDEFIGLSNIYIGLIYLEQNKIVEAKNCFKKAVQIGNVSIKVKLKYFLLRAIHFKNQGNLSQAQKLLRLGLNTVGLNFDDDNYRITLIDLVLELSEFYIHHRKDSKKAIYLLNSIENYLSPKEINNIRRAIRWNLLMSDFHNFVKKNRQKSQFYLKQSQKLKLQLQTIGLNE